MGIGNGNGIATGCIEQGRFAFAKIFDASQAKSFIALGGFRGSKRGGGFSRGDNCFLRKDLALGNDVLVEEGMAGILGKERRGAREFDRHSVIGRYIALLGTNPGTSEFRIEGIEGSFGRLVVINNETTMKETLGGTPIGQIRG